MRKFILALPFMFVGAQASAACSSAEDMQAKAMEMMTVVQQLAQKNPTAAQEWSQKTMKAAQDMADSGIKPDDFDKACKFYDDLIADAKKGL
ncbi:hypothetical protein WJT86_03250 [Microvirga sp. W0021]|uniref:Uncharacterized protein n=1 Tax=Hohaiivirga grylli TaxID=3133970 RepID=A0ABV0BIJ1_9HYPH